jgi:hypothetical protein
MSDRHKLAAQVEGEQNLKKLALLLTAAVNECEALGIMPSVDAAVMVICYQIAFSGNGDSTIPGYYQRLWQYCCDNQDSLPPLETKIEHPHLPT